MVLTESVVIKTVAENKEADHMVSQHGQSLSSHETTPGEVKYEVGQGYDHNRILQCAETTLADFTYIIYTQQQYKQNHFKCFI